MTPDPPASRPALNETATVPEPLTSVVYTSRARAPFTDPDLEQLLSASRASNRRRRITGVLLYRAGHFIQILEGPDAAVRELLRSIQSDPRHADMRIVRDEAVGERRFAEWSMGYEPISPPSRPAPEGFRDTFDDLGDESHPDDVLRAIGELTLWFRVRSRHQKS